MNLPFKCPLCGSLDGSIVEARKHKTLSRNYRKRHCNACRRLYWTTEESLTDGYDYDALQRLMDVAEDILPKARTLLAAMVTFVAALTEIMVYVLPRLAAVRKERKMTQREAVKALAEISEEI